MSCPNLLPVPVLEGRSKRRRVRKWLILLSVEALALSVACIVVRGEDAGQIEAPREVLEATGEQINLLSSAIAKSHRALEDVEQRIAISREVTSRPDWSIVLSLVARHGKGLVQLSSCQLSPGMREGGDAGLVYRASMAGSASTQTDLTDFVQRLKETGAFTSVRVLETRRVGEGAVVEGVRFMIEAVLSSGGGA